MVTLALWTTVMAPGGNPPVLKWVDTTDTTQAYFDDGVNPDKGTTSTGYIFRVTYTDPENDAPTYVRTVVGGTTYAMAKEVPSCSTYSTGCVYSVTVTLSVRSWYTHHFETSDGTNAVRFPPTTEAAGPLVGDGSAADVVLQYMRFLYTQDTEYAPFDQSSMFVETYLPLVGHVDTRGQMSDNMFDGLIFYDGLLGVNEGPRYGKVGTQIFVDTLLPASNVCSDSAPGVFPLCALDKATRMTRRDLGNPTYKFGVFVAAPIPCRGVTGTTGFYGDTCADGGQTGTDLADQENIAAARVQAVIDRFGTANPQGLSLIGFYQGYRESLAPTLSDPDSAIVKYVADYVHARGLKYTWIPWCDASGISSWPMFGFDWVTEQPNYAWQGSCGGNGGGNDYTTIFSKINTHIQNYGLAGMEFEIAHETRTNEDLRSNARSYLDAAFQYQWDTRTMNTYFTDGISLMSATSDRDIQPQMRTTYDWLYHFLHPSTNVALRKTGMADFSGTGYEPDKALDGQMRTYWSTFGFGTFPHWWRVDLGSSQFISRVTLRWSSGYAYRIKLEGSTNDIGYSVISDRTSLPNLSPQVFTGIAASYRYVRVTFTARDWGPYDIAHLREVEIALSDWGSALEYFPREDTYAVESSPSSTCGTCPELKLGSTSSPLSRYHAYFKFDLRSAYLAPGRMVGVYFYGTYFQLDLGGAAPGHQFTAAYYVSTDTWSESTLTWSNAPSEDASFPLGAHITYNTEKYERSAWEVTYKAQTDTDGTLSIELRRVVDSTYVLELGQIRSLDYVLTDQFGGRWEWNFWPFLVVIAS